MTPSGPTTAAAAWSAPHVVDRGERVVEVGHGRKRIGRGDRPGRLPRVAGTVRWVTPRCRSGHAGPHAATSTPLARATVLAHASSPSTATSVATATEFPAGNEGYHSYTEVTAEVAAVAAAHPSIVSRFSIGKSYQGRDIWAVKISDNVATDEAEPEVMFDGTHHADEHMATEMTLHILHWLADGYGADPRITSIVDTREIWIVFVVNPDGAEFDIAGGHFHFVAQEPPADARLDVEGHRPQPQLQLPLGRRRREPARNPSASDLPRAGAVLGARGRGRCATSWPAASSTAVSRSGPRSRSTSSAGW